MYRFAFFHNGHGRFVTVDAPNEETAWHIAIAKWGDELYRFASSRGRNRQFKTSANIVPSALTFVCVCVHVCVTGMKKILNFFHFPP